MAGDDQQAAGGTPEDTYTGATDSNPDAAAQGFAAAAPAGAAPQAQNQPQTEQPQVSAQVGGTQNPQSGPVVLTPQKRGGLAGIIDEFRNAISPQTTNQIYVDKDGNQYQQHPTLTGAQQWARVGATALRGAAAGMAYGKGAGNGGKAAFGAMQDAEQQADKAKAEQQSDADRESDQIRQQKLDTINSQILQTKLAANQFALTRLGVKATQDDVQYAQQQRDRQQAMGSALVFTGKTPQEFFDYAKNDPDHFKDHIQDNALTVIPRYNADGTANGVEIWKELPDQANELAPQGTKIRAFLPPAKPGEQPTFQEYEPSDPITMGRVNTLNAAADVKMQEWRKNDAEVRAKAATADKDEAEAGVVVPKAKAEIARSASEVTRNYAEAGNASASAAKSRAETNKIENGTDDNGALVDEIGTGKMNPGNLSRIMTKNPGLLDQVATKYPGFDSSKIEAYTTTYKDFTSGKTSQALNAGGTALKHLEELDNLNTPASHIPHTAAWTRYQNKAETVATELAKFYGDSTLPGIAGIKDTLTSTLPGNREAAIRTQATSMGDKLDSYEQEWRNAAPSAAYQAPMPGIDNAAKAARAALDPRYAARFKNAPAAPAAQPGTPAPAANPFSNAPTAQ